MILEKFAIRDRVAIVTGAGRGIGAGIALGLAEAGAHIVCASRTAAQIEDIAARIRALGREAIAVPTDVADEEQAQRLAAAARERFGRIDILVNCAGTVGWKPTLEMSAAEFRGLLDIHLTGTFNCCRAVAPTMLAQGSGAIVNIASTAGVRGLPGMVNYGAAKAGIINLTKSLAQEWGPAIRVNCLAVGGVLVDRTAASIYATEEMRAQHRERVARKRLGTAEDIALATLYFVSDASDWVTGETLNIDGGIP
jgi:7-alpha-hydroxysteroid dehydrogenase